MVTKLTPINCAYTKRLIVNSQSEIPPQISTLQMDIMTTRSNTINMPSHLNFCRLETIDLRY